MSRLSNITFLRHLHDKAVYPFYLRRNRQIFSNLPKQSNKSGKIALFLTVRTLVGSPQTYLEATIAHALESSGLRVLMLYCDNMLDSCDLDTYADLKKRHALCDRCKRYRKRLIGSLSSEYCSYREFLTPDILKQLHNTVYSAQKSIKELIDMELHGVRVGDHAVTSVIRYFLTYAFDDKNPEHLKIFKDKLYNACVSVELAHKLHIRYGSEIGHVIMVHGIYATWGPFYDYFRSKNIDSIIYSLGIIRPRSIAFLRNARELDMAYPDAWRELKNRDLTLEELKKVDEYINNRLSNNLGIDLKLHAQVANGDKKKVMDELNSKPYKNRYIFYTHMIWDSALENQSAVFNGFVDMFDKTVEYFLKHTDKQLIIKIHPSELIWEKGSYSMLEHIKKRFSTLTGNIYILPPSTPVNAYEIINEQTMGLTYVGSLGYELSLIGVPVLIGGIVHYHKDGGVGIPVNSLEQYHALLDDPGVAFEIAKKKIDMAKKWCYFFYYMLYFDIPTYTGDRFARVDWTEMKKLRSMLMDRSSSLNRFSRKIKEGKDVIND